ncbi:hypothetical protein GGU11DRAFT_811504 [Lentinula aff. detonsa]|nr:hypothetical protein GGU11DRAFT_811504 [Lentinula aff. detonsa]
MGSLPVLQLDPSRPPPPVPPSVHPSGVYIGPFMDGWETGRFVVCPHTCQHSMNARVIPVFRNLFIWPVNISGRSYDHTRNINFHRNCTATCPGHERFGSGNVPERRPATLAETIRGVIEWSRIVHNHRETLQKRELAWVERVEAGPDPAHLQFQDIPTHISQAMRPFDLTAALSGLPAMSGSAVPGPGPVVCGYHGWGAPSIDLPAFASNPTGQPDPSASPVDRHSSEGTSTHGNRTTSNSSQHTLGPSNTVPAHSPAHSLGPSTNPHSTAQPRISNTPLALSLTPEPWGTPRASSHVSIRPSSALGALSISPTPSIPDPTFLGSPSETKVGLFQRNTSVESAQPTQGCSSLSRAESIEAAHSSYHVYSPSHMAGEMVSDEYKYQEIGKAVNLHSEQDVLQQFKTLAAGDSEGQGLSSRSSEIEENMAKLPKKTLFLLYDNELSPKPLKNLASARNMQEQSFHWCILKWQMTYERRRLFHAMYKENKVLQQAMYFHITPEGSFLNAELYIWEWITLALLLWEQGGHVDFMLTSDFCKMLHSPEDMPVAWKDMKKYQFVFFSGSSDPLYELTDAHYRSLQTLTENNMQIWPHPLSVKWVLQKSVIHSVLARTVCRAGGFSEKIFKVESISNGLEFLRRGYVIKRDCSSDVFFPNQEQSTTEPPRRSQRLANLSGAQSSFSSRVWSASRAQSRVLSSIDKLPYVKYSGEDVTTQVHQHEDNFRKAWNLNSAGYTFFALKYNPSLIMLGEVRTFITFGRVIELIHTIPENPLFNRHEMLHERCHGNLNDITKMTKPKYRRFLDISQQRRFHELWYCRDLGLDYTGTHQITEFALKVYDKLVSIEESLTRSNQFHPGIAGSKVCVRLDIGVIWDSTGPDPNDHRYRFIVNKIQPGDAAISMIDGDARRSIPRGIIQGILKGSLDQ